MPIPGGFRFVPVSWLFVASFAPSMAQAAVRTVCEAGCDHATIQAAVDAAAISDEIRVQDEVHVEGGIVIAKDLSVVGRGRDDTTVAGPPIRRITTFRIEGAARVRIEAMTIAFGTGSRGGLIHNVDGILTLSNVRLVGGSSSFGGGIFNDDGRVLIEQSKIDRNRAEVAGGGIFNSTGRMEIENSEITVNEARFGGGVATRGGVLVIRDSMVTAHGNIVGGAGGGFTIRRGGGVDVFAQRGRRAEARLERVVFRENFAEIGGGISLSRGELDLAGSSLLGNRALRGGGIATIAWTAAARVTSTEFSENEAEGGGAIDAVFGREVLVHDSLFSGNRALVDGGAVRVSHASATIEGSSFVENRAARDGGAIRNEADLVLANSTVGFNRSDQGVGGVSSRPLDEGQSTSIINTTVHVNRPVGIGGREVRVSNSIVSANVRSDCEVTSLDAVGPNLDTDGSCDGFSIQRGDPNLSILIATGLDRYFEPRPGSDAIDRGDDGICAAAPVESVDQIDVGRPQGVRCDLGAVEVETPANGPPSIGDQGFLVPENSPSGTHVGFVSASDPDDDALSFVIVDGNTGGAFALDPESGELTVNDPAPLDAEVNPVIALLVEVSDPAGANDTGVVLVEVLSAEEDASLQIEGQGVGGALVVDFANGIECTIQAGATSGICEARVPVGTHFLLDATVIDARSILAEWSGCEISTIDASGLFGLCEVTVVGDATVTATIDTEQP